ncbi:Protein kinase domain family protein [Candida albicans]|uniref:Protein kinase domain family protein n=1 Tax=Candida albicans TaxID=5476 RepID=A0A8H6BXZ4_CANAX|nr:Protein kinase domain family protein [Candida albicans]
MDIPLKSKPKVSTVNLLADSKFEIGSTTNSSAPLDIDNNDKDEPSQLNPNYLKIRHSSKNQQQDQQQLEGFPPNYTFSRRYSETEKNNFDPETGHRIFADGKIRPHQVKHEHMGSRNTFTNINDFNNSSELHARSHDSNVGYKDETGYEEFIPGLDFSSLVSKWNSNSNSNLDLTRNTTNVSLYTTHSNTPRSRDGSYLDLNLLHSKVAPQPIKTSTDQQRNLSYSKLHEFMKTKQQKNAYNSNNNNDEDNDIVSLTKDNFSRSSSGLGSSPETSKARKKQKSAIDPITGEVNYELIINSLPPNFNDMPYSQRKKLVKSFSESIDYSQFSLFAKNYLGSSVGSAKTLKGSSSGTGIASASSSLSRRNRVGSLNTLAGRLLARTSTTDFKKLQEAMKPKYNVDEKGAIVLGHELGKVIGFGAWGTIRECTDQQDGTIRAIKIVNGNLNSKTDLTGSMKSKNPRVLEVFKKEIQIWKQLHHDNILPLIDYYETEDAIFCIMNRINGEYSFEEQLQALLYMHEEKGIVHGDLKLENVLVEREKGNCKMILCDFGMSRVYSSRISRKSSKRHIHYKGNNKLSIDGDLEDTLMMRSRSSNIEFRKPYFGGDSPSSRKLDFDIRDDSRVGLANFFRAHGPSMQSIHLTPVVSENGHSPSDGYFDITNKNDNGGNNDKPMFSRYQQVCNDGKEEHGIDSGLPHSHIGSLPYASPEILQPSPPPLGPSADVWAFGVLCMQ